MSSGQQQPPPPRRVTNVGSLLLTPQENESLFTFLGKKCVVSGRAPRRRPRRSLTGAGPGSGSGEGGGSGASPGWLPPRPSAAAALWPRSPGASRACRAAPEQGSVTSAGLSPSPAWPGPGPRPCSCFKLYSQATTGSSCPSCVILGPGASLHLLPLDLGLPSFTMPEVSGVGLSGRKPKYE